MKRRQYIKTMAAGAGLLSQAPSIWASAGEAKPLLRKAIPFSGEKMPAIGMGTWLTFNVPTSGSVFDQRVEVLREFFKQGGGMIDSSPMYGNAEAVIGAMLPRIEKTDTIFSATKVWSPADDVGRKQFEDSFQLWGLNRFDLQQVHNLVNWRSHLKMLRAAKEGGRIRYIGVTTSHGRRHKELEQILRNEPLDFVQLTYNASNPEAEPLIDLAAERGVAVIVNRPLDGGLLIKRVQRDPLPSWAKDMGIRNWPDFLLRWIVSHTGVTCAIPATSQIAHMQENMEAGRGPLLDAPQRERMQRYVEGL